MIVIGYSGHAFVACGILKAAGQPITGYCDKEEKTYNPFATLTPSATSACAQPLPSPLLAAHTSAHLPAMPMSMPSLLV